MNHDPELKRKRIVALLKFVSAHPQGVREDRAIAFMARECESSQVGKFIVKDAEVWQLVAGRFKILHVTPEGRTYIAEHDHSVSPGTGEASLIDKGWDTEPVTTGERGGGDASGPSTTAPGSKPESLTDG